MTSTVGTGGYVPDRLSVARSVLLVLVLLALVATAGAGLRTGVQLLNHRSERAAEVALVAPTGADIALGEHIRTSFGALTAAGAEVNNGLTEEDLGGMSHGVSSLVGEGLAQVEVSVTLANTGSAPVIVAADQFRLVTRKGTAAEAAPIQPSGTTLLAGPLPPRASVDTRVAFVVPTDGSAMWLLYTDPARKAPVRISLGRTDSISAPVNHQH